MFLLYNTLLFIGFALFGGGRYDWAYQWGAVLLALNALPFLYRLVRQRGQLLGRGPVFWLLGVLLPWCVFGGLFYAALSNPSHELLYPRNLFSPLIPLEYQTALPTTPHPARSRLFLLFVLGLLCLPRPRPDRGGRRAPSDQWRGDEAERQPQTTRLDRAA